MLREAFGGFSRHGGAILGGALAFYALLSAAPLGVIAVAIAGFVFGAEAAHGELNVQLQQTLGPETAALVGRMMDQARQPLSGGLAALLSTAVILFAASRLFFMLNRALNQVLGVRTRAPGLRRGAMQLAKKRLLSFAMVLSCGLLLTLLLVARTVLTAVRAMFDVLQVAWFWRIAELGVAFGLLATLIALMFRFLPDVRIAVRDIWVGAGFTSLLIAAGTYPIGVFVGFVDVTSAYGAGGTVVALLLWVYYSSHIFFLGAEFLGAWARRMGHGVAPMPYAVRIVEQPFGDGGSGDRGRARGEAHEEQPRP